MLFSDFFKLSVIFLNHGSLLIPDSERNLLSATPPLKNQLSRKSIHIKNIEKSSINQNLRAAAA
jgi:hypothetical protein